MIIAMRMGATDEELDRVISQIEMYEGVPYIDRGAERVIIGVRSARHDLDPVIFRLLPGVENVIRVNKPYKLASREFHPDGTSFKVKGMEIGGNKIAFFAGPCSIESEEQIISTALAVKKAGATCLRGGAFKPRSSPYAFQGMGEEGLKLMAKAGKEADLPIVTEIMHPSQLSVVAEHADILQIGARNMQNYDLLKDVASTGKPVFIKRGMAAKIEDLLMSAEYLLHGGCNNVMLCERGIRTFETATRNTLDIAAVPVLKKLSHLPVVIDPSHAAGHVEYVESLALAAIASGADGLMIEVHPSPKNAKSDGQQSLTFDGFTKLMESARRVAEAVGKTI